MTKRTRALFSVKNELIQKSRESMLTAVQIFNNPNVQFKSETFIVLVIISWTYLMHAYYRDKKIEYRYFEQRGKKRKFDTTKHGAHKYWELERCLNCNENPVDKETKANLLFLIGLRHEIEHQMTTKIDDYLSARFQACCLNYNNYIKNFFGEDYGIENYLSFSLQFSSISENQIDQLSDASLPKNISAYIKNYDDKLDEESFNDSKFSYRVLLFQKVGNRKGQADRVIEFVDPKSEIAESLNKEYWTVKDREKPKYLPSDIWKKMQEIGFDSFKSYQHTKLWQDEDAKNPAKGYGVQVQKTWYWYESWLSYVHDHCKKNESLYKTL